MGELQMTESTECKLRCELCQSNYHDMCDSATCDCKIYQRSL